MSDIVQLRASALADRDRVERELGAPRAEQLNLSTGRRSPLPSIAEGRPSVTRLDGPAMADDAHAYAYTARERVSRIFVIEGGR